MEWWNSELILVILSVAFVIRIIWIRKKTKRWREVYLPLYDRYREALAALRHAKILGRSIDRAELNVEKAANALKNWMD